MKVPRQEFGQLEYKRESMGGTIVSVIFWGHHISWVSSENHVRRTQITGKTEVKINHVFFGMLACVSCLFLLACTSAHAQQPANTEKLQNIRKLIVLLGGLDMQKRSLQDELSALTEEFPQLRAEYGEAGDTLLKPLTREQISMVSREFRGCFPRQFVHHC